MKKVISFVLVLAIVFTIAPSMVFAENCADNNHQYYITTKNADGKFERTCTAEGCSFTLTYSTNEAFTLETVEDVPQSLNPVLSDKQYTFIDYSSVSHEMPLYVITLPGVTTQVSLKITNESNDVIIYNYDKSGNWLAGSYENNGRKGTTSASFKIDANNDGIIDYLVVQTPYDSYWKSFDLFAITFEFEAPFDFSFEGAASYGNSDKYIVTKEANSYTTNNMVYSPDAIGAYWGYIYPETTVDKYVIHIPSKPAFNEYKGYILVSEPAYFYNYRDAYTYLEGSYNTSSTPYSVGDTKKEIRIDSNGDNVPDIIQVQKPYVYDEELCGPKDGELLYVLSFEYVDGESVEKSNVSVTLDELINGIAGKITSTGISFDVNAAWLTADMIAYANLFPATENTLSETQKEGLKDYFVQEIEKQNSAGDVAKSIIALVALGYDPSNITSCGLHYDGYSILNGLTFTNNIFSSEKVKINYYSVPYVLIAYQQFENKYSSQIAALKQNSIDTATSWNATSVWGVDSITPFMLALGKYKDESTIGGILLGSYSSSKSYVGAAQTNDGSISQNAASTGLAAAGFAACGVSPSTIKYNNKDLVEALLSFTNTEKNKVGNNDFDNEQGFRGLLAAKAMYEKSQYNIYDFSTTAALQGAELTVEHSLIKFGVVPNGASVTVKSGSAIMDTYKQRAGIYDLEAGTYTYEISKTGYETKTGTITVSSADDTNHVVRTINVSLTTTPVPQNNDITVHVLVLTHNSSVCGGKYTYKHNSSAYTTKYVDKTVTIKAGQTAFDAFDKACASSSISYVEASSGYISSINGLSEFGHGSNGSGWMFMVGSEMASVGCRDYIINSSCTMKWVYTDDYSNEFGSEEWTEPYVTEKKDEKKTTDEAIKTTGSAIVVPFTDVKTTDWFYAYVTSAYALKMVDGVDATHFDPESKLSRAMLITMLWKYEGRQDVSEASSFVDVEKGSWYEDPITWAYQNKIINGMDATHFAPNANITREQAATILYNFAKYKKFNTAKSNDLASYTDSKKISTWAVDAISWANALNIMVGDQNKLRPASTATRAEAATLLVNFLEKAQ